MPQHIGIAILFLSAFLAYLCLAWQIWCAVRWLRRRWFPTFSERVDRRARAYTPKSVPIPHPLWAVPPLTLAEAEAEEAFHIPKTDAGPSLTLSVELCDELPSVNLGTGATLQPTISTPRTEASSKSTSPPGPATSPGSTGGPGSK